MVSSAVEPDFAATAEHGKVPQQRCRSCAMVPRSMQSKQTIFCLHAVAGCHCFQASFMHTSILGVSCLDVVSADSQQEQPVHSLII